MSYLRCVPCPPPSREHKIPLPRPPARHASGVARPPTACPPFPRPASYPGLHSAPSHLVSVPARNPRFRQIPIPILAPPSARLTRPASPTLKVSQAWVFLSLCMASPTIQRRVRLSSGPGPFLGRSGGGLEVEADGGIGPAGLRRAAGGAGGWRWGWRWALQPCRNRAGAEGAGGGRSDGPAWVIKERRVRRSASDRPQ